MNIPVDGHGNVNGLDIYSDTASAPCRFLELGVDRTAVRE